jgi:hypothetical protein
VTSALVGGGGQVHAPATLHPCKTREKLYFCIFEYNVFCIRGLEFKDHELIHSKHFPDLEYLEVSQFLYLHEQGRATVKHAQIDQKTKLWTYSQNFCKDIFY